MYLFGRNEAVNQWLAEHPAVLGLAGLVFAAIFFVMGISALLTGRAPTKRGGDLEGGNAKLMGVVWVTFGTACLIFGVIKILSAVR